MVRRLSKPTPSKKFPLYKAKTGGGVTEEHSSFLATSSSSSSEEEDEAPPQQSPKEKTSPKKKKGAVTNKQIVKPPSKPKKPYRPSATVLREIKAAQAIDHCIPRAPFHRLVRELTIEIGGVDIRYSMMALIALQEAAEDYLTGVMEDSYLLALHAKRVTLMQKDIQLAYRIRGDAYRY